MRIEPGVVLLHRRSGRWIFFAVIAYVIAIMMLAVALDGASGGRRIVGETFINNLADAAYLYPVMQSPGNFDFYFNSMFHRARILFLAYYLVQIAVNLIIGYFVNRKEHTLITNPLTYTLYYAGFMVIATVIVFVFGLVDVHGYGYFRMDIMTFLLGIAHTSIFTFVTIFIGCLLGFTNKDRVE